jgi:S1-C subfamily serine protease
MPRKLVIVLLTFFTFDAIKVSKGWLIPFLHGEAKNASKSEKVTPTASQWQQLRLNLIAETVQKVGPAVVRLETVKYPLNGNETSSEDEEGTGSGFIFSQDGLILTNAHVIKNAREIDVIMTDGREYAAAVKGVDPIIDVAVLQIVPADANDKFPSAKLVDSDELKWSNCRRDRKS